MTPSGLAIVRNAAAETHRRNPAILQPIEAAFGVSIEKRLKDDAAWAALVY
jgi:hypothetical protein